MDGEGATAGPQPIASAFGTDTPEQAIGPSIAARCQMPVPSSQKACPPMSVDCARSICFCMTLHRISCSTSYGLTVVSGKHVSGKDLACLMAAWVVVQASSLIRVAFVVRRLQERVSGLRCSSPATLRLPYPSGVFAPASIPAPVALDSRPAQGDRSSGEPPPLKRLKVTFSSAARGVAAAPDGVNAAPGSTGMLHRQASASNQVRMKHRDGS